VVLNLGDPLIKRYVLPEVPTPVDAEDIANKAYVDGILGRKSIFGGSNHGSVGDNFLPMSGAFGFGTITNVPVKITQEITIRRIYVTVQANGHTADVLFDIYDDGSSVASLNLTGVPGQYDSGEIAVVIAAGSDICIKEETTDSGAMTYNWNIEYD